MIAREAEFVVVLPSQLTAVFPIIQDNLCLVETTQICAEVAQFLGKYEVNDG